MKRRHIVCMALIILTIISVVITVPKAKKIEQYKVTAINPVSKQLVEFDKLMKDFLGSQELNSNKESIIPSKSLLATIIQLCLFENEEFSDILFWVVITSLLCSGLAVQLSWLLINAFKNFEGPIVIVILAGTLLITLFFGAYFIGVLIILICAIVGATISMITS